MELFSAAPRSFGLFESYQCVFPTWDIDTMEIENTTAPEEGRTFSEHVRTFHATDFSMSHLLCANIYLLAELTGQQLYRVPLICNSESLIRSERLKTPVDALKFFFTDDFFETLADMMNFNRRLRNESKAKVGKFWSPSISDVEARHFVGMILLETFLSC
jgi:hypothetical protein